MFAPQVPFQERASLVRGMLDFLSGRYPRFVFGGSVDLLPVFHFHGVTREPLETQLRYLAENGYRTVTADDIGAYVRGRLRFDRRSVALCFDDAWASLWTIAAPLLKKYGLTVITYAIPGRIEDAPRCRPTIEDRDEKETATGPQFVTWPELRALQQSGIVDVQSHTDTHSMVFCSGELLDFVTPQYASTPLLNRPQLWPEPALRFITEDDLGAPLYLARSRMSDATRVAISPEIHARCVAAVQAAGGTDFFRRSNWRAHLTRLASGPTGPEETESEQQRAIEEELDRSRSLLRSRLGTQNINHICLPWGVAGRRTSHALARLGYLTAFANRWRGELGVRPGDHPHWLKRLSNRYIFLLPGQQRRVWLRAVRTPLQ
jgi:peptidoglycan/xylan/chitin deacetylase (PgdA/CDA1 family)